ncbi:MAG: serine hydrolase domain-containing protein [Candidatus Hodarchaeota archaeon]
MIFSLQNNIKSNKYPSRDYWPTIDWLTSTPEEQGMNSTKLNEVIDYIKTGEYDIDSVVVIRNGYIVLEEYFNQSNSDQDSLHFLASVTKSFTSTLIGVAIQEGFIESVSQKVVHFFPDREIANLDARKQNMTLEHLLTMTAGFNWSEWDFSYSDPRNSFYQMYYSEDPVQFVLDLPMAYEPGKVWTYNTGASQLLSAIITKATNQSALDFANECLYGDLGIADVHWERDSQGVYYGGFALYLKARDMAKLGYLFLNNGTWDSEQIISPEWVVNSTRTAYHLSTEDGYGYHWWTFPNQGIFCARGSYGQSIFVVPERDIIVVFTAYIQSGFDPEEKLFFDYILPAVLPQANPSTGYPTTPSESYNSTNATSFGWIVVVSVFVVSGALKRKRQDKSIKNL